MTLTYNYKPIKRGDTVKSYTVTVLVNTLPASLTSARIQFRDSANNLVFTGSCSIVDNVITIAEMTAANTRNFPVGTLNYDLEITFASGLVRSYMEGSLTVTQDYTI